jgi:hypothetical protein
VDHRRIHPVGEFFGTGLGDDPSNALMFRSGAGLFTKWWPTPFSGTAGCSGEPRLDGRGSPEPADRGVPATGR